MKAAHSAGRALRASQTPSFNALLQPDGWRRWSRQQGSRPDAGSRGARGLSRARCLLIFFFFVYVCGSINSVKTVGQSKLN